MKALKLALLSAGVSVCASWWAFAGEDYVEVKEKAVVQDRHIDYNDEEIAHAVSLTITNGDLDVRSKVFRPPPNWVFLKFRDVASENWPMFVDIAESPEQLKSWADPDTEAAIGVNGIYIPPENAGAFPMRCEGNLEPIGKGGVGVGGLPSEPKPHHWSAKIDFWTNSIDVDVDSDNNNGVYGPPHRDEKEEKIEEGSPGKYLPKDDGDRDEDLVQGFADGFGTFGSPSGDTNFVPVVVDVKKAGEINWGKARLRVSYPASDPSHTVLAGTAEKPYHQAQGIFRLWTQEGKKKRKPEAVDAKGDWIAAKEYAAKLLIDPREKTNTWYAEGIQEGGYEGEIAVEFDPLGTGEWLKDKARVTVVHGDVDVDSDNDNGFNPPKRDRYEDRIEAAPLKFRGRSYPGKLMPLNDGDVDRDGVPDWGDGFDVDPRVPADDLISTNVPLFVPIVFDLPAPLDPNKVRVRLRYSANDPREVRRLPTGVYVLPPQGELRVWRTNEWARRDKRSALENGDYVAPGVYEGGAPLRRWFRNGRTVTCWLEAVRLVRGARIYMDVDPDGTNGPAEWVHEDYVKVSVLKVELTHIKFDYQGPDKGTSDGLNIRKDYDNDLAHAGNGVGDGEWILDAGRNEPFLYVVDKTVKIKAKFRITPGINTTLEIGADSVGGIFPNVTPKTVSFAGGVSIGDAKGYVEFDLAGKTHEFDGDSAKDVAKSVDSWQWKITAGIVTCEMNVSGPHTNYCVLDVPQEPWFKDTKTHPWVSALDLVCVWADGKTTIPNAVSKVTKDIYNSNRFVYEVDNHYREGSKVKLTECIETINGSAAKDANCEDCANFVVSFGNLLGADYSNARMGTFSGWPGSWQPFLCNKVCPIGLTLWYRADFDWHRVCWTGACAAGDKVFDASLQYDADGDPSAANNPPRNATIPTDVVFGSSTWTSPCDTYRECLAESGVSFTRCQPDGDAVKRELK